MAGLFAAGTGDACRLLDAGAGIGSLADAFRLPMLVALDDREDYSEERWIGIGVLNTRVVVVVYTERNGDTLRIISLMKATSHERIRYEQLLRDQLGAG